MRSGAGRPRGSGEGSDAPGPADGSGIPWKWVRHYARLGGERDLIVVALGITTQQLEQPDVLLRLQQEMERGAALYRLDLLQDMATLRSGGEGSVNATIAALRQALGWDRPDAAKSAARARPDADAGAAELEQVVRRFRAPR